MRAKHVVLTIIASGFCAFGLLAQSAFAADPVAGAACSPSGIFTRTGGVESSGVGALMVCSGGVWKSFLSYDATANAALNYAINITGAGSPAQITADQNDYNPAELTGASILRLSSNFSVNITGLAGGSNGRVLTIFNIGNNNIVLKNQSSSSTTSNRFAINADIALATEQSVTLIYDSTSQRWRSASLPFSVAGGATFDAGSGFFVLSKTAYTGNLGGLTGADAKCLSDVTTYDWLGKTFAQSAGIIDSTHVKSWLCDTSGCNNVTANKKYYFSVAGNPKVGGGSFTATAAAKGPSDSSTWIDDNHFGGPYSYWTNRNWSSNTLWNTTPYSTTSSNVCSNWSSTSPSGCSKRGLAATTNHSRFNSDSDCEECSTPYYLICLINP